MRLELKPNTNSISTRPDGTRTCDMVDIVDTHKTRNALLPSGRRVGQTLTNSTERQEPARVNDAGLATGPRLTVFCFAEASSLERIRR